jgi:hypothetical protein
MGWPDVSWRFHGMKRASGEDAVLHASPIASETNLSPDEKATKVVCVIADDSRSRRVVPEAWRFNEGCWGRQRA